MISFCEILYYIANILCKINNILFSWQVSLSSLSEFSGSVFVFWQHCGKYMLQILPLTSAFNYQRGRVGLVGGGGGGGYDAKGQTENISPLPASDNFYEFTSNKTKKT